MAYTARGELTRLQIVTEASNTIGRDLTGLARDGVTTTKARLNEAFETAQMRLARAYSWPELDIYQRGDASTVIGQKAYTFSALFGSIRVKQVLTMVLQYGVSSQKLIYKTPSFLLKYMPDVESLTSQKSVYYTTNAEEVWIYPTPNLVYPLNTLISPWPTRLTNDSDKSEFRRKDDILTALTIAEAYKFLEEFDSMTLWNEIAKGMIVDAIKPMLDKDDFEPEGRAFGSDMITKEYWVDPFIDRNP